MIRFRSTLPLVACLLASASAWTTPGVSRKDFLKAGAAAAAAAAATSPPLPAHAAVPKVYQPEPGSLTDKLVVITGGTAGLGLESAKRLAKGGASVVLTSRTASKGEAAVRAVEEYLKRESVGNPPPVYAVTLDLDDLSDTKAFAGRLRKLLADKNLPGSVDVLMNNAGVMAVPDLQTTADGYERTFQSNHLGHFVLTATMMPLLAPEATVINVSSEAYLFAKDAQTGKSALDLNNLNGQVKYGPWSSYGLTKLANIMFTDELQRRADAAGLGLVAVSMHPGAVATDLGRNLVGPEKWNDLKAGTAKISPLESFALNALSKFTLTVPEGASTQIFLAASDPKTIQKAAFYVSQKPKGLPAYANDPIQAEALWEASEKLGGVKFDVAAMAKR